MVLFLRLHYWVGVCSFTVVQIHMASSTPQCNSTRLVSSCCYSSFKRMIMSTCQTLLRGKCNKKDSGTRKWRKEETLTSPVKCVTKQILEIFRLIITTLTAWRTSWSERFATENLSKLLNKRLLNGCKLKYALTDALAERVPSRKLVQIFEWKNAEQLQA